ncbi:MAG: hypothetical protein LBT20_04695 [Clostridiales bacterium]|jgi:hypothetical protein|nr:hypothetical protein [Clostridiales bacterium]
MFEEIFGGITILAVVGIVIYSFLRKKKDGKDKIYGLYFLIVLITGTVLYSVGLAYKEDADTSFSILFVIAKGLASALKMFSGDFNASAVAALGKVSTGYKIAVFVNYCAGILLAFLVIIRLFGKNLVSSLKVLRNSLLSKYIIVGYGNQAELFLKNLDKKNSRITVILEAGEKDKKKELIEKGYAVVVIRDDDEDKKRKNAKADKKPKTLKGDKKDISAETRSALKKAGYERNKFETKILAMSENDETNLLVAKIVTEYIKGIVKPQKDKKSGKIEKLSDEQKQLLESLKFKAYIMYDFLERTEHFAFTEYALGRVRFFNPYEVRARKFAIDNPITKLIPSEWINTEKARLKTSAESGQEAFRVSNVFVGFGWTNKQILKKSICNNQLLGANYNALVIDKDAKKHEMQFKNNSVGLFDEVDSDDNVIKYGAELKPNEDKTVYFKSPKERNNILFEEHNVLSSEFYKSVADEIEKRDEHGKITKKSDFVTVVIALGSDKLSIETALELRQKLYERNLLIGEYNGKSYDRVRIFVKIVEETVLSDESILNDEKDIESKITTFGADAEILSEEYIIDEALDEIAKSLANRYWEDNKAETAAVTKWDKLTEFKRDSNRYSAMSVQTKLNLLGFDLKRISAERSESIAAKTDKGIEQKYNEAYGMAVAVAERARQAEGHFVDFPEMDGENIIDNARNNLARLEHQRWNAVHLVGGWTKLATAEVKANNAGRQNEKAKQHACITTFKGLSDLRKAQAEKAVDVQPDLTLEKALAEADTVCYDFDVMDRVFGILKDSSFEVTLKR